MARAKIDWTKALDKQVADAAKEVWDKPKAKKVKSAPKGLFTGKSAAWDEATKKAVARKLANETINAETPKEVRQAIQQARQWYTGSTKGGAKPKKGTAKSLLGIKPKLVTQQDDRVNPTPASSSSPRNKGNKARPVPRSAFLIQTDPKKLKPAPENPYRVGTADYQNWNAQESSKSRTAIAESVAAASAAARSHTAANRPSRAELIGGKKPTGSSPLAAIGDWMTGPADGKDAHPARIKPGTPAASRGTLPGVDRKKKKGSGGKGKYTPGR